MSEVLIIAFISSFTSCLTVALPLVFQTRKERRNQFKEIKDGLICSLRNDILQIYLKNKDKKEFSLLEKQTINYSYRIYNSYGGNSFIKDIVDEMNTWKSH